MRVDNVDLLLSLPCASAPVGGEYLALSFVAPRRVELVSKAPPSSLRPDEAQLSCELSMVSTGAPRSRLVTDDLNVT